jgi:hypothetical protein
MRCAVTITERQLTIDSVAALWLMKVLAIIALTADLKPVGNRAEKYLLNSRSLCNG